MGIIASVLMLIGLIYVLSKTLLLRSYDAIERDQTTAHVYRANDAIQNVTTQLSIKLVDWASWDDSYQFIVDNNQAYRESNLGDASIRNLNIHEIAFIGKDGNIFFDKTVDLKKNTQSPSTAIESYIQTNPDLFRNPSLDSKVEGIIATPEGLMFMAALPITTSRGEGPVNGMLLFGSLLDEKLIKEIADLTHLAVTVHALEDINMPSDVLAIKDTLIKNDSTVIVPLSDSVVAGYTTLFDVHKKPVAIIKIETPRDVYAQGVATLYSLALITAALVVLFGVIILIFIERLFIVRFSRLSAEVDAIGKKKDFKGRVLEGKDDEIGMLATTINQTLETLSAAREAEEYLGTKAIAAEAKLGERVRDLEEVNKIVIEREKRVLSLKEELEKFKLVIDNTSQHIVITDPDGVIVYANPAVKEITGYSHEEVIGATPSLWGKQMPADYYTNMWRTIKQDKKTFAGEIINKRKNGEFYTAKALISPILNDQGEVKFFVALESDISKEKALEKQLLEEKQHIEQKVIERTEELQEERAKLLASINSIPFGFIIADKNHRILMKNKAIEQLFTLNQKNDLYMEDISHFFGEELDVRKEIKKCPRNKALCELKEITIDKKIYRTIISPILLTVDKDEIIGYVFLIEDITEAKVLERSREEFFAVASHELRTPLTAIRGNMSMFRDFEPDLDEKDKKEIIDDTYEASIRLIGIVNDFLDTSRLEQGKVTFKKEPIDVTDIILETAKEMAPLIAAKQLKLKFTKPKETLPPVLGDHIRLKQTISNLIDNAIKYTEKGTITITAKQQKDHVVITVTDTGKGISEQNQSLLFRKFQQAGEEMLSRDVSQSAGLGLYITKLIIEAMGGTVELTKSALGKGSTFTLTVPISL